MIIIILSKIASLSLNYRSGPPAENTRSDILEPESARLSN